MITVKKKHRATMNLITHICWLLILHLPIYSQASNHAESSFRFEPDYEYKYGTVPKRKDKRVYQLRAYYTYPPKWKPKNSEKPKFVFFNQDQGYYTSTYDKSDIPIINIKDCIYTKRPNEPNSNRGITCYRPTSYWRILWWAWKHRPWWARRPFKRPFKRPTEKPNKKPTKTTEKPDIPDLGDETDIPTTTSYGTTSTKSYN